MIKPLQEFTWDCDCGERNTGYWQDAAFCECDNCGNFYSFEELRKFIEDEVESDIDLAPSG